MRPRAVAVVLQYPRPTSVSPLAGNPLRTIRRGVLSGGAEPLKKYLRTRAPDPTIYSADAVEAEGVVYTTASSEADRWRVARRDVRALSAGVSVPVGVRFRRCLQGVSTGVLELSGLSLRELPVEGLFDGTRPCHPFPPLVYPPSFTTSTAADDSLCARLRQLNASNNALSSLPPVLARCEALQVSFPQPPGVSSPAKPRAVLQTVILAGNGFRVFPEVLLDLPVAHLDVSGNSLTVSAVDSALGTATHRSRCLLREHVFVNEWPRTFHMYG